jgi:hypothetical protein
MASRLIFLQADPILSILSIPVKSLLLDGREKKSNGEEQDGLDRQDKAWDWVTRAESSTWNISRSAWLFPCRVVSLPTWKSDRVLVGV